jgi:hypothetical protein
MIGPAGLTVNVSARSLTTTPGSFLLDLAPRLTAYEQTCAATFGYESAVLTFAAEDLDEAIGWADRLFCPVTVDSPDAVLAWDGYIAAVELRLGGKTRSLSLETIANRVRARYTTALGTPAATAAASHAASVALYGTHDAVLSLSSTTLAAATALRDSWLARYAFPRAQPTTTIREGSPDGTGFEVILTCAGWYATLDFVVLERTDTSSEATTAQVASLIGSSTPGIGAINTFLSTNSANIVATGVSVPRAIEADTSYRAAIEKRLALGDTTGQRYAWGVFDLDRRLTVRQWAGATPATLGYLFDAGEGVVRSGAGLEQPFWLVRPDTMVEDVDLVPVGPPSGSSDILGRWYLERVVLAIDESGMTLTLEPEATSGLDARIARLSG